MADDSSGFFGLDPSMLAALLGGGSGGQDTPIATVNYPPDPPSSPPPAYTSSDFLPGMGGPGPNVDTSQRPRQGADSGSLEGGMGRVAGQQSGADVPAPKPPIPPSWSMGGGRSVPPPQAPGGTRSPQAMQMLAQMAQGGHGKGGGANLMQLAELAAMLYMGGAF